MGTMRMLKSRYGDLTVTWDAADQATVDAAITAFEKEMAKGMTAVATTKGKDVVVREFTPDAEEIVLFPQIAGG